MPFQSRAQMKALYAKNPKVAKEFAKHTSKSDYENMPEHVTLRKKTKKKKKLK
jgi:hypothetical protein